MDYFKVRIGLSDVDFGFESINSSQRESGGDIFAHYYRIYMWPQIFDLSVDFLVITFAYCIRNSHVDGS